LRQRQWGELDLALPFPRTTARRQGKNGREYVALSSVPRHLARTRKGRKKTGRSTTVRECGLTVEKKRALKVGLLASSTAQKTQQGTRSQDPLFYPPANCSKRWAKEKKEGRQAEFNRAEGGDTEKNKKKSTKTVRDGTLRVPRSPANLSQKGVKERDSSRSQPPSGPTRRKIGEWGTCWRVTPARIKRRGKLGNYPLAGQREENHPQKNFSE